MSQLRVNLALFLAFAAMVFGVLSHSWASWIVIVIAAIIFVVNLTILIIHRRTR